MAYTPNAVLPDSQEGILLGILEALNQLVSNSGVRDPLTGRQRVTVEANVALPANQSTNIAQWNGQTAVTGIGASGNGAPRVTPSSDVIAGVTSIIQIQQQWANAGLVSLYANIAVS